MYIESNKMYLEYHLLFLKMLFFFIKHIFIRTVCQTVEQGQFLKKDQTNTTIRQVKAFCLQNKVSVR